MSNPNIELGFPNLEEYYMMMAYIAASRANCLNRAVGAVIVTPDNRSISSTGYNGVPKDLPHCQTCRRRDEGFKSGEGLHRSRATHAEANVIVQAAKYGRELENTIMYVTDMPCSDCCKLIINSGIKKVYYCSKYPGSEAIDMLSGAGIEVQQLDKEKIISHLKSYINAISNI